MSCTRTRHIHLLQPPAQFHMQISLLCLLVPTGHMHLPLFTSINHLNAIFKMTCRFEHTNMKVNSLAFIPTFTDTKIHFSSVMAFFFLLYLKFCLKFCVAHSFSEKKVTNLKNISLKRRSNAKKIQMESLKSPASFTNSVLPHQ